MKIRIVLLLLLALPLFSFAQNDSLNHFDAKGKKDGKWIVYLDEYWNQVPDSADAAYYRFTWYDHGVNIYPMGAGGGARYKMTGPDSTVKTPHMLLLDGQYKFYDEKGRLIYVHTLKQGVYISYKEFFESGKLHTFFDYTQHCEDQPHSWFAYYYDKRGNLLQRFCVSKNKHGKWPALKG